MIPKKYFMISVILVSLNLINCSSFHKTSFEDRIEVISHIEILLPLHESEVFIPTYSTPIKLHIEHPPINIFHKTDLNHIYSFQNIKLAGSNGKIIQSLPQIHWVVDDIIRAQAVPIIFQHAEGLNATITTSWGNTSDLTLKNPDLADSIYSWVDLPDSKEGIGNIDIILKNEMETNHTVQWSRLMQHNAPPISLSFTDKRFSYWNGQAILKAEFFSNDSAFFNYTLEEGHGPTDITWFPYNYSFNYKIGVNTSIWLTLCDYLRNKEAINWQSWDYFPNLNYGDRGGWEKSVVINWNESYQTSCIAMVDDDSGINSRKLVTEEVMEFFEMLMTISNDLIRNQMEKNSTTIVGPFNRPVELLLLIFVLAVEKRQRIKSNNQKR